ncbi:NAD(P)/FAD-dependent oxidoreductase [Methanohalophilus sp.]|uniref:NAD(P)/FAD-dependent oxidoreductase n=1 Tax=Methanohalophilus sp. TaxID=1966352 RepID=UPI002625E6B4|nr:NAD(P)/FAD-dependent oxidoreductase [Methanohalophilus sp.]MDK2892169.1 digeranylgeranylglycerophospholipid reductase [Methanohalophilus sp.]
MDADVIVIGGSPAGLATARKASSLGCRVLLLDKKESPGNPPHPANTFFKGMFDRAEEVVDKSYVLRELRGAKIVAPSGGTVDIISPAYFIDRSAFDRFYAQKTLDAGVEILSGVEAYNIIRKDGEMSVSTSEGVYSSPLVVVSNGIKSNLAALCGLSPIRYPQDIAWAKEAVIEADGIGEPDMFEYYLGSIAPGWKSTYSPCGGNRATLGTYVRRHGSDVSAFFDKWVEKFKQLKGISDMEILEPFSTGGDPIITIPKDILADGLMLVGGTAGQSGIGYSMHAGNICGRVAADAVKKGDFSVSRLSDYRKAWNKAYRVEHWLGRIGLEALRKMDDREIDRVMQVFEGKDMSFLRGTPFHKSIQISMYMLRHDPLALLNFKALLRNR